MATSASTPSSSRSIAGSGVGEESATASWPRLAPPVALALFALGAAAFRLRSGDAFWHLVSGQWILEQRAVPRFDPFRFTSGERAWVDHEWLFQLAIHLVERAGGVPGLVVMRMALVLLLALLVYRAVRAIGLAAPESGMLATLAVLGARPRFLVRPELPTLILLTALLWLLRRERDYPRPARVVGMTALTVLWVNLHGAAILAPAVAGAFLLGSRLGGHPLPWRRVLGLPALLFVALLLNPYGWKILLVAVGIGDAMRDLPAWNAEWVPAWVSPQPFLFAGIAAVLLLVVHAIRRRRRLDLGAGLVALALTAIALSAVRHQALFYVGAAPFLADTLVRLGIGARGAVDGRYRRRALLAATVSLLALVWCLVPPSSGPLRPRQGHFGFGFGIEPERFPERAADFLELHPEIGPLYNTFAHGGYLLWRLHPSRRVFHDGRMELQPGLLREIAEARRSNVAWDELLERYGAVGGLVRYDERPRPVLEPDADGGLRQVGVSTSNTLLFPRSRYALVYWDDYGMLLLERSQAPPALLAREYRFVEPEDLGATLERAAHDREFRRAALAESERRLREDPSVGRAASLRDALLELEAAEPTRR